jgi:branched-chain amino acid transport system substrate-binding protein
MRSTALRALVLATAVALAATACGTDSGEPAQGSAAQGDCDAADPVRFGALASLTGPSADLGALVRDGVEIGVEDVNAAGGVLGRCVELIVKDDAGDPTTATQATRELVDQDEVDVLVGPVLSSPTGASLEVSSRVPVTQMALAANPVAADTATFPHSFMTEFTSEQITEAVVDYLERQGHTRPAVIAVNNALGTFLENAFREEIAGTPITLATDPQLHDSGLPDLSPQVRTLVGAQPDVLVVFQAAGPDQAATVKARNQLAPGLPVVGIGAMANVAATGALTPGEMEGVVSGPFFEEFAYNEGETAAVGEAAEAFLQRYREHLGGGALEVSASQAASAYDATLAVADAINAAGDLSPDAVRERLESTPYEGTRGTYRWTPQSHAGVPIESSAFVLAASLRDGILQLAPGEGSGGEGQ